MGTELTPCSIADYVLKLIHHVNFWVHEPEPLILSPPLWWTLESVQKLLRANHGISINPSLGETSPGCYLSAHAHTLASRYLALHSPWAPHIRVEARRFISKLWYEWVAWGQKTQSWACSAAAQDCVSGGSLFNSSTDKLDLSASFFGLSAPLAFGAPLHTWLSWSRRDKCFPRGKWK